MNRKDAAFALAENIVKIKYENIPASNTEATKMHILDTLGTSLAASTIAPASKEIVSLISEVGGNEESSIIAFGGKAPSWMAAFANGAMAHALDYDDHNSMSLLPAAFAIAERAGKVSGKDFLAAVTLALDVQLRLAGAVSTRTDPGRSTADWVASQVSGYWSAAAAAGKILGLDEDKLVNAFGLAYSQAGGSTEIASGSDSVKGIYGAFPALAGVLGALMAQRGIPGIKNSLEGKAGLFNLYFRGKYDITFVTNELGKKFEGSTPHLRLLPCCGLTHPYIEATLAMVNDHNIGPQDVEEIIVHINSYIQTMNFEPSDRKRKPQTITDAQFSMPYHLAVTITRRQLVLKDFMAESFTDPSILQLAAKVTPRLTPISNNVGMSGRQPGIVEVKTRDGQVYVKPVPSAMGQPRNPIGWDEVARKFQDCASYSVKPLPDKNVKRAIEMASELEKLDDVSQLIKQVS